MTSELVNVNETFFVILLCYSYAAIISQTILHFVYMCACSHELHKRVCFI